MIRFLKRFWHHLIRRIYAFPVLACSGNYYVLSWHWPDGSVEIEDFGKLEPGTIVHAPRRAQIIYDVPNDQIAACLQHAGVTA